MTPSKTFILPDGFETALDSMSYDELDHAHERIEQRKQELRDKLAISAAAMGLTCSLNGTAKPRKPARKSPAPDGTPASDE